MSELSKVAALLRLELSKGAWRAIVVALFCVYFSALWLTRARGSYMVPMHVIPFAQRILRSAMHESVYNVSLFSPPIVSLLSTLSLAYEFESRMLRTSLSLPLRKSTILLVKLASFFVILTVPLVASQLLYVALLFRGSSLELVVYGLLCSISAIYVHLTLLLYMVSICVFVNVVSRSQSISYGISVLILYLTHFASMRVEWLSNILPPTAIALSMIAPERLLGALVPSALLLAASFTVFSRVEAA